MVTEIIKTNIEAAFSDRVEIGRTTEKTGGALVFIAANSPGEPAFHIYFSATEKAGLDETIEGLMRARREVFGTKP